MNFSKHETPIQFISKAKQAMSDVVLTALPPLSLYIHIPWCVRKCPYCDFNSHEISVSTDFSVLESAYVDALIQDVDHTLPQVWGRRVSSIFIGGGTPSVMSAQSIDTILSAVRARLPQVSEIEVTMEANFRDDLDADSLDLVELIMAFEEEFGGEINDDDAQKIATVGDAVHFLDVASTQA